MFCSLYFTTLLLFISVHCTFEISNIATNAEYVESLLNFFRFNIILPGVLNLMKHV